jgi:hypothetical protein
MPSDDVREYVGENRELLVRVLAHGDAEARGYALAALSHGGTVEDIEAVEEQLAEIKRELLAG